MDRLKELRILYSYLVDDDTVNAQFKITGELSCGFCLIDIVKMMILTTISVVNVIDVRLS